MLMWFLKHLSKGCLLDHDSDPSSPYLQRCPIVYQFLGTKLYGLWKLSWPKFWLLIQTWWSKCWYYHFYIWYKYTSVKMASILWYLPIYHINISSMITLNVQKITGLFFYWPPVRELCPNYEVVMFQLQTGTLMDLGPTTNCYVYILLKPSPPFSARHPISSRGGEGR